MSQQLSDSDAWKEIQKGNKILFEGIFRKYYQMLCAFAISKLKDGELAEEIVQSKVIEGSTINVKFDDVTNELLFSIHKPN